MNNHQSLDKYMKYIFLQIYSTEQKKLLHNTLNQYYTFYSNLINTNSQSTENSGDSNISSDKETDNDKIEKKENNNNYIIKNNQNNNFLGKKREICTNNHHNKKHSIPNLARSLKTFSNDSEKIHEIYEINNNNTNQNLNQNGEKIININETYLCNDFNNEKVLKVIYKCTHDNCDKAYKSKENLNLHIKNKHLNQKPYQCNFCDLKFSHRNGNYYYNKYLFYR
jgi:hypothetical protein